MSNNMTPAVKGTIRYAGLSVAAYVRGHYPDGLWRGAPCGCPDDRCVGSHHEAYEQCDCLPALLVATYSRKLVRPNAKAAR